MIVIHPKGEIPLANNIKVENEKMLRNCVWIKNGRLTRTAVAPTCRWRFAANHDEEMNYPPGKNCKDCGGGKKCYKGCPSLAMFGGLSM